MQKHNPENARIKHRYFHFLREARGRSAASVEAAAKALSRFESDQKFRSFKAYRPEQAMAFKRRLAEQTAVRSGRPLSKATLSSTMAHLREFIIWLADQPGYKSHINYTDAAYFHLSEQDERIARARLDKPVPTLEQIRHVIDRMPIGNAIQLRDRAVVALILLTGARDGAVKSLKLKHLDLAGKRLVHDAREVTTKARKSFVADFLPVGERIEQIVSDWVGYLTSELHWGPDDPLFPVPRRELGPDHRFRVGGLERRHWTTTNPIRDIFRHAYEAADMPYYSPHQVRHMLAALAEKECRSPEEFKAWSQSLGHSRVLTTFTSYGKVEERRQSELIRGLGQPRKNRDEALQQIAQLAAASLSRGN
jgi:integrase